MAKTPSSMLPLGTPAPNFSLPDVISGDMVGIDHKQHAPKATVVMFICNHCPYVKHVNEELTRLAKEYMEKGVRFIAINSNDIDRYPDDSPENMKKTARENDYPFPYLFDETQEVAKAYQATCTPDFFVFDNKLTLSYRGQLDDSRPGNNIKVDGSSLRYALDRLLASEPIPDNQKPSLGCNIKWKQ